MLSDAQVEQLWQDFDDITIDNNGFLQEPFMHFPAGTDVNDIYDWFDDQHSLGFDYLLEKMMKEGCQDET